MYNRTKSVNFGSSRAGLTTVGYTLTGGARQSAGVSETVTGSGCYAATVAFPAGFQGTITWDTGGTSPTFAVEDCNPAESYLTSAGMDAVKIEGAYNARQVLGLLAALVNGLVSGMDTDAPAFKAIGTGPAGPTRAAYTTDPSGNRLTAVLTPEA